MRKASQFSFFVLLFMVTSVLAAEQPLESGYFKWLLHLGQTPTDRILHSAQDLDQLGLFGGEAMIRPRPGDIYDFSDNGLYPATTDLMIWTPQYDAEGFFGDEQPQDDFIQYYHIYIFSPEERQARLRFRAYHMLRFWNNGELILDISGWDRGNERYEDFLLHEGVNSMTFKLKGPGWHEYDNLLAMRITDRNETEYTDLTYTLSPPLPAKDVSVSRLLPADYDPGTNIEVTLSLELAPEATANELTIIEYIPEGLTIVDAGGGSVIGNSIQWSLAGPNLETMDINYSLAVLPSRTGPIAFLGYFYHDKKLENIFGESVMFEQEPPSASDMVGSIETIDINAGDYARAENVTVAQTYRVKDYSASLENSGTGLVSGLKPHQTGGWAEYEFSVTNPGKYHIVLDYGELWTMFHHAAEVSISIDGSTAFQTQLFPTTHSYGGPYPHEELSHPWEDPERKAKWVVDSANLSAGPHTLRMTFPPMYATDVELDRFTDGRPVITKIIITNYPGLTLPYLAEPHHLDSYEHAPARIVHDRNTVELSDDRVEMTFYGTFYSLSQGNEIYFADGHIRPRPGETNTKFEIVSIEPEVFYLPPGSEQDFMLVVRSQEPVPENYSELVVVWLQGPPSSPSRRPYLFTTAQSYITLPAYKRREFAWSSSPLFSIVRSSSRYVKLDVTDPAVMFIPDKNDLAFNNGRYERGVVQYFKDQFVAGNLPSVQQVFQDNGWDYEHHGWRSWGQAWSAILGSLYWREDSVPTGPPGRGQVYTTNSEQAKAYVKRLSENMVFYPVTRRWDWARHYYLPNVWCDVGGISALAAHVRTAQEDMIDDNEQFKILHNLVLPNFNSYWDELRTTAILTEDANGGDINLHIARPLYGATGSSTNGFFNFPPRYIKVGGDLHRIRWYYTKTITLREPVTKSYPKGTSVTSWGFIEEIELEGRDIMSLLAIGAASRDRAVVDEIMHIFSEILEKQKIFMEDGSFKNEPGSYGGSSKRYPEALLKAQRLFGQDPRGVVSQEVMDKLHSSMIYAYEFPFSNGMVPQLNGGGAMNQMNRGYHGDVRMLEELFPEDIENISLYKRIAEQEKNRLPGDIIDNHNFVIDGWGYAMLRSENGSWDRGMETLLSSKYLLSDPGDHVSPDCLGIVIYGLGAILTPRYGYSWVGFVPPCLNQVMVDDDREGNRYYGSFWHFDGRKELPSAVAHTGDGNDCSELDFDMSRWCIQFPEYLFDAYFIEAKDANEHKYDWCLINMGDLEVVEPADLSWQDYSAFLDGYWPQPGTRGEGERTIASKTPGNVVADWKISNGPWIPYGDETLLRFTPEHGGCLRLIVADDSPGHLINAQIGYYDKPDFFQANSQDILVVRKNAVSHTFVDTLEAIADDEDAYVKDVVVVERGNYNQQLVEVTTIEGQDRVYLSGNWGLRPDGDQPLSSIATDADIVAWRVINNVVRRVYLAGGSYANTAYSSWNFGSVGNHYVADADGDGVWDQ